MQSQCRMELRQLLHFVAVAEEESFTRAAQCSNIVQSALSTSIRQLEEELGAKLFVRNTRKVRLTAVGRAFLEKANIALEALRQGKELVADIRSLRRGKLALGTVQSLPSFIDLPALLETFHDQHPDIEVRLCQGSASHLIEKIRSREIELVILPVEAAHPDLSSQMICCDLLVLACAMEHHLAEMDKVTLKELSGESFIDFEPTYGTRELVDHAFADARLERRVAFEVSDLNTLLELVARGLGVALIPQAVALARKNSIAHVQLADVEICWELAAAYNGDIASDDVLDAAPAAFLGLLIQQGAGHRGEEETPELVKVAVPHPVDAA
jgi:DNA-binding transcriptional LysR family regulator